VNIHTFHVAGALVLDSANRPKEFWRFTKPPGSASPRRSTLEIVEEMIGQCRLLAAQVAAQDEFFLSTLSGPERAAALINRQIARDFPGEVRRPEPLSAARPALRFSHLFGLARVAAAFNDQLGERAI
jgi:hypothetical protein